MVSKLSITTCLALLIGTIFSNIVHAGWTCSNPIVTKYIDDASILSNHTPLRGELIALYIFLGIYVLIIFMGLKIVNAIIQIKNNVPLLAKVVGYFGYSAFLLILAYAFYITSVFMISVFRDLLSAISNSLVIDDTYGFGTTCTITSYNFTLSSRWIAAAMIGIALVVFTWIIRIILKKFSRTLKN